MAPSSGWSPWEGVGGAIWDVQATPCHVHTWEKPCPACQEPGLFIEALTAHPGNTVSTDGERGKQWHCHRSHSSGNEWPSAQQQPHAP